MPTIPPPVANIVLDDGSVFPSSLNAPSGNAIFAEILATHDAQYRPKPMDTSTPFNKLVQYGGLTLSKTHHLNYEKANKILNPYKMDNNESLFGIEIEVENCKNGVPSRDYYWQLKEDGSLRNYGMEFVSIPLRPNQIEYALNYLNSHLLVTNTPEFTGRTSVHVHMNARDFTINQLKNFVILYAIFEKHFYSVAGTKRENNIFCVPLYKTNYLRRLPGFCNQLLNNWSKYCGLNLSPMVYNGTGSRPYGTVEFRHLYGTSDKNVILPWINMIIKLREAALNWDHEKLMQELLVMNTVSSYYHLYKQIFKEQVLPLTKEDFEFCISQVKKELFFDDYSSKIPFTDRSQYFQVGV